jgi:hypothetical protein
VITGSTLNTGPVAVPPGVVTDTVPVTAVAGTVVSIDVPSGATDPITAATPLNFTLVTPARLVPVIVTAPPAAACAGLYPSTFGVTKKLATLNVVAAAFVTAIFPDDAPAGTLNFNCVEPTCVNAPTSNPFNVADVTESRFAPLTVTNVPTGPEPGANDDSTGGRITTKLAADTPDPDGVVTVIFPVTAANGTVAVI